MDALTVTALSTVIAALVAALASMVVARHAAAAAAAAQFEKLKREFLLEHQSEQLVRRLLQHQAWSRRSLSAIKRHIRGFDDEALRQILIRAGAIRFSINPNPDKEFWGLVERNEHELSAAHESGAGA